MTAADTHDAWLTRILTSVTFRQAGINVSESRLLQIELLGPYPDRDHRLHRIVFRSTGPIAIRSGE